MDLVKAQGLKSELILDTPNRNEILKDGPPDNSKCIILGRGSYGVVFKALYAGKQVAVKIIKNLFNGKADAISNEANILGWRHRNIIQLLKIESTANYGIAIMERFPGQCLQFILDSIDIPLEHRIYVALDVSNALIYCHKREILHLDVKPQNILVAFSTVVPVKGRKNRRLSAALSRSYICKLCDFGSSVMALANNEEIFRRRTQGTVRYMSPEALREDILSPAADVFSLGVTMWQLKSRQLPYSWIECNETVAYQVVKTHLRPTATPPTMTKLNIPLAASNSHKNCLCHHFSSEISYRSMDNIRAILEKTKTLSPFAPKNSALRKTPEKLRNQISRNLIETFQSTFVGLKEDLLVDKMSSGSDIMEELKDDFPLTELFRKMPILLVPGAENLYEDVFISCWQNEAIVRPKTTDIKQKLLALFAHAH